MPATVEEANGCVRVTMDEKSANKLVDGANAMLFLCMVPMLLACTLARMVFTAYVATALWGWFAVPAFAAPPLRFVHALGLLVLVRLVTYRTGPQKANDKGKSPSAIPTPDELKAAFVLHVGNLAGIGLTWGFGYLIHLSA